MVHTLISNSRISCLSLSLVPSDVEGKGDFYIGSMNSENCVTRTDKKVVSDRKRTRPKQSGSCSHDNHAGQPSR